jgi:hypothetical protein
MQHAPEVDRVGRQRPLLWVGLFWLLDQRQMPVRENTRRVDTALFAFLIISDKFAVFSTKESTESIAGG